MAQIDQTRRLRFTIYRMTSKTNYISGRPDKQKILDLFNGEWSCALPPETGLKVEPGLWPVYKDTFIDWMGEKIGGYEGKSLLELGPLEASHSKMFHDRGAVVAAVEANSRAFLKCLCIKEVFGLERASFLLGDCVEHLRQCEQRYDMICASGVLYHMTEPVELIKLMAEHTDHLYLRTHFYDEDAMTGKKEFEGKFMPEDSFEYENETYRYSSQTYGEELEWKGFCGGGNATSRWLTRDSLMRALARYGFANIDIYHEDINGNNGPAIALYAGR